MTLVDEVRPDLLHPDGRSVNKNLALVVLAIAQLMVVLDAVHRERRTARHLQGPKRAQQQ